MPGQEELSGAHFVEREALDSGDVHPEVTVDARTLDAHDDAVVGGQPRDVVGAGAVTALVIAGEGEHVAYDSLLQLPERVLRAAAPNAACDAAAALFAERLLKGAWRENGIGLDIFRKYFTTLIFFKNSYLMTLIFFENILRL